MRPGLDRAALPAIVSAIVSAILLTAAGPARAAGSVEVRFKPVDQYTDAGRSDGSGERSLQQLGAYFESLGARLPEGQVLTLDVQDIDLAGELRPAGLNGELRVARGGADWPAMTLRWSLAADGRTLASGEDRLSDMDYLSRGRFGNDDPLFFEKRMVERWFEQRLGPRAASAPR
jgi:hypothetical protein